MFNLIFKPQALYDEVIQEQKAFSGIVHGYEGLDGLPDVFYESEESYDQELPLTNDSDTLGKSNDSTINTDISDIDIIGVDTVDDGVGNPIIDNPMSVRDDSLYDSSEDNLNSDSQLDLTFKT